MGGVETTEKPRGDSEEIGTWKKIAAALDISPSTAQTWAKERALPVFRSGGKVFIKRESLKTWIDAQEQEGSIYRNQGGM